MPWMPTFWTPERDGELRRVAALPGMRNWADVARAMNLPQSNVASRAHRLGLQSPYVRLRIERLQSRRASETPLPPEPRDITRAEFMAQVNAQLDTLRAEFGRTTQVASARSCQWTECLRRPWFFCDAPAAPGTSWCAEHAQRVFVPRAERKATICAMELSPAFR